MQIHHIQTTEADRYVLDPQHGPVLRREQIIKPSDITSIVYGSKSYERQEDGSFDVDDETARFLVGRKDKNGMWHNWPSPYAPDAVEALAAKAPPKPRTTPRKA